MGITIEKRLERLERENRRLKLAFGAVAALIGGAALMGQAAPKPKVEKVIRAEAFEVVGPKGEVCATLGLDDDAGRLRILSKSGEAGINLVAADNGTFIDVMGQMKDDTYVTIGVKEGRYEGPFITITRDNDTVFAAPGEFYKELPPPL